MKIKNRFLAIITLLFLIPVLVSGGEIIRSVSLNWLGVQEVENLSGTAVKRPTFRNAVHNYLYGYAPLYHELQKLPEGATRVSIQLLNSVFEPLTSTEAESIDGAFSIGEEIEVLHSIGTERGSTILEISLVPLKRSSEDVLVRLMSFDLLITYEEASKSTDLRKSVFTTTSVLTDGKWYKIRVSESGICKVTYADLQNMGVDMLKVTPSNIRLFGKPGGMLPENNGFFRYDDLPENAIEVVTATPGVFAPGDYFLFYGTSPDEVVLNTTSKKFEHKLNYYSDHTYYFLNFDKAGEGKRIGQLPLSNLTPQYVCSTYIDFRFYNNDLYNLIKSGKQWVGERLDFNSASFSIPGMNFSHVVTSKQAWIRYRLVARATSTSNFSITANSTNLTSKNLAAFTLDSFSQEAVETKSFVPVEGTQSIGIRYNTPNSTALGYIDFIELNVPRFLHFTGGQMLFSDPVTALSGAVTEFKLSGIPSNLTIWDVTSPVNIVQVDYQTTDDTLRFILPTDSLRRFVAWDHTTYNTVEFVEIVENQNLHGIENCEMLIVTHPDFLQQANRLADHHRIFDGMTVAVATNQQIYNEFSSGSPDIAAIRDFARMLYLRPEEGGKLRYLLLFGDGSYDYKDYLPQNTNYVLAFQTKESQNLVFSTASDDFFALLDPNEGSDAYGRLDIGVGRFPVISADEAKAMVDKCIFYATGAPENLGEWRNSLCFIADDEDSNTHIRQVEDQVTPNIEKDYPVYNLNKVYLDAYTQVSTPSGTRYPDVNKRINELVQKGVLIMNYTGHGGETGWATEAILTLNDINSWTNYTRLPVFVTATCEFSRFDDPGRVSAGEQVFLSPFGGAVALLTTTRLANAGNNVELTIDLYDTLFSKSNGNLPRFGDVIAYAKNQNSGVGLIRNFMLLGDPAMHLAFPRYQVVTSTLNGKDLTLATDTIAAMSKVEAEGVISDNDGNLVETFNGIVDIKVFDKYKWMMTRGNDPTSYKRFFDVQESLLYQGKATVTNGRFSYSFIVPKDIDFSYGNGKISYYAYSETTDAAGYNDSIVIGGSSYGSISDTIGPLIKLYMNDERFVSGGITGENPMLLAYLSDESGLNTVGNGIGHDLVATLDGNSANSIVLNDFYQSDLDNYRAGKVKYFFQGLEEGPHTLTLKAWDVFNNSSEASIEFVVKKNLALQLTALQAFPNPFDSEVRINFEHNLFNETIEARADVFNLNGSWIGTLGPQVFQSEGFWAGPLIWNGRHSSGTSLSNGLYLVRIRATNGKTTSEKSVRLVKVSP